MKVVILAAGMGTRFVTEEGRRPKCLIPIRGRALLGTNIDSVLAAAPDAEIVVVTGFMADTVDGYLRESFPAEGRISSIFNPDFEKSVVLSTKVGFGAVSAENAVLLINGDTLFNRRVFQKAGALAAARGDTITILGNRTREFLPDDMKLSLSGPAVRRIGKTIDAADAVSSGAILLVGAGLRSYLETIRSEAVLALRTHHGILQAMLERGAAIDFEDLGPVTWLEIDRSSDLDQDFALVLDW